MLWYWQKSTSADDGALDLLDRLAAAELRVRDLEARLRLAENSKSTNGHSEMLAGLPGLWGLEASQKEDLSDQQPSLTGPSTSNAAAVASPRDDLKVINGIGPTYEQRLNEAGIYTFADLSQQKPDQLRQITGIKPWQATDPQQWIDAAQSLS